MAEDKPKKKTKTPAAKRKTVARKKTVSKEETESVLESVAPAFGGQYVYSLGRRKRSTAQVRIYRGGTGIIFVNQKPAKEYFTRFDLLDAVYAPLRAVGQDDKMDISIRVLGGGIRGQAEAARHGISRALILVNPTFRVSLKRLGFLKRDPREKERKKYGLHRARRAPQWSKR